MLQLKLGVQLASRRRPLKRGLLTAPDLGAEPGQIDPRTEPRPEQPSPPGGDLIPANRIFHGHSPRAAAEALAPHVLHVHATDATRDLALARGIEVPLGQGNDEFPELLALLEEQQYRGYITVARKESDTP